MSTTVGIDSCRAGWCCVELAGEGAWQIAVVPDFVAVWARFADADLIFVDIPIGLRDRGSDQRLCDVEARKRLGTKHSSVFTPPLRSSLAFLSYEKASANNFALSGRKLSRQAWGIAPKIAEVDRFLATQPMAARVVREVHPEILFWRLNGDVVIPDGKKTTAGKQARRLLLGSHDSRAEEVYDQLRARYSKSDVGDDDVFDALAAAVCAHACTRGPSITLPARPELDSRGLPMEIVLPG